MNARKLIEKLERLAEKHGDDIPVAAYDEDGLAEPVVKVRYEDLGHGEPRLFIEASAF